MLLHEETNMGVTLDPKAVKDFIEFAGYTETEFWNIVDKFYNREIFELNEFREWILKHPIC